MLAIKRLIIDNKIVEVKTEFVHPPITFRGNDWIAWIEGQEEGHCGRGITEPDAIADLKQQAENA